VRGSRRQAVRRLRTRVRRKADQRAQGAKKKDLARRGEKNSYRQVLEGMDVRLSAHQQTTKRGEETLLLHRSLGVRVSTKRDGNDQRKKREGPLPGSLEETEQRLGDYRGRDPMCRCEEVRKVSVENEGPKKV